MDTRDLWVGTYTGASGRGQGIYRLRMPEGETQPSAELAATADNPSYLAHHPGGNLLYGVSEKVQGELLGFGISAGPSLHRLAAAAVPAGPCHLTVHPDAGGVLVASYVAGAVSVQPLDPAGRFIGAASTVQGHGSGPVAQRQEGPHAHAVAVAPDGTVLSTDLGADLLRAYRLDPAAGTLSPVVEVKLPPGSGPRHLVVNPAGYVYVLTELAHSILVLEAGKDYTDLTLVAERAATADGVDGFSQSAAIRLSGDCRLVYTSMRGADVVTVHEVSDSGASVRALLDVNCGGQWPRDLCVVGDRLYVANEHSHSVAGFRLTGGIPSSTPAVAEVPSPACLLPAMQR